MKYFINTKETRELTELITKIRLNKELDDRLSHLEDALMYVATFCHDQQLEKLLNIIQREFPEYGCSI